MQTVQDVELLNINIHGVLKIDFLLAWEMYWRGAPKGPKRSKKVPKIAISKTAIETGGDILY